VAKGATPLQQELLDLVGANIAQMTALLNNFKTASDLEHDELRIEAQAVDIGGT
jgi:hypothetical protein